MYTRARGRAWLMHTDTQNDSASGCVRVPGPAPIPRGLPASPRTYMLRPDPDVAAVVRYGERSAGEPAKPASQPSQASQPASRGGNGEATDASCRRSSRVLVAPASHSRDSPLRLAFSLSPSLSRSRPYSIPRPSSPGNISRVILPREER